MKAKTFTVDIAVGPRRPTPDKRLAEAVSGKPRAAVGTKFRCAIHLFVSEGELILSLLQRPVVQPLFNQARWPRGTLLRGSLLQLALLAKIIGRRG